MEVDAALALLKHAEGDDAQSAPGVEYSFPALLALASTCRALRAALQPRRVQLAKACWLRAFGAESLGACAAWQRVEQLGGSAFEARWRWLHGLRTSSASTRAETIVTHAMPNKGQLRELEFNMDEEESFDELFHDGGTQLRFWRPSSAAIVAGGGVDGTLVFEAVAVTGSGTGHDCRFTFALCTGAAVHIKASYAQPLAAFGGIGVLLQPLFTRVGLSLSLLDITTDAKLHNLCRSAEPRYVGGANQWQWATSGTWSVGGTRLAIWGRPRPLVGAQPDSTTIAVYVFELDAADPPPSGPLESVHMLILPKFASLAFGGSGDRIYTAVSARDGTGALKAWHAPSGRLLAEAALTYEPAADHISRHESIIVPYPSVMCVSMDSPDIDLRCPTTLAHVGRLQRAPLLGGHGSRVSSMRGVADVLLSCDEGGILLAWHVPTRQLLHRLGRDVFAAPPAGRVLRSASALGLTSRGVALIEDDCPSGAQSRTRLINWLP